jgi:hypothetical protein
MAPWRSFGLLRCGPTFAYGDVPSTRNQILAAVNFTDHLFENDRRYFQGSSCLAAAHTDELDANVSRLCRLVEEMGRTTSQSSEKK